MLATNDADLALLADAVRGAGQIARDGFNSSPRVWDKSKGNPVTETDLAVDHYLREALCGARPSYGWLSEETTDNSDRLSRERVFIVDPIDGTIAFIKRKPEFVICAAIVERGVPVASAMLNPMTDHLYLAAKGSGATCNGTKLSVTTRAELEGCRMLVAKDVIEHPAWPRKWPSMDIGKRASIALRMALVAEGQYDAMMALSSKNEWDTAAASLLVEEAGGVVTLHSGSRLTYNQAQPVHRSIVCTGPALHRAIMDRTGHIQLP